MVARRDAGRQICKLWSPISYIIAVVYSAAVGGLRHLTKTPLRIFRGVDLPASAKARTSHWAAEYRQVKGAKPA
jgi:hypothetical protein